MKKIIIFTILLMFIGSIYAYRTSNPPVISKMDSSSINQLNNFLQEIYTITNGRYNFDITSSVPTVSATEGEARVYVSGTTRRFYIYVDSSWRYINFDG
jgi:hypothetical protein